MIEFSKIDNNIIEAEAKNGPNILYEIRKKIVDYHYYKLVEDIKDITDDKLISEIDDVRKNMDLLNNIRVPLTIKIHAKKNDFNDNVEFIKSLLSLDIYHNYKAELIKVRKFKLDDYAIHDKEKFIKLTQSRMKKKLPESYKIILIILSVLFAVLYVFVTIINVMLYFIFWKMARGNVPNYSFIFIFLHLFGTGYFVAMIYE